MTLIAKIPKKKKKKKSAKSNKTLYFANEIQKKEQSPLENISLHHLRSTQMASFRN